MAMATETSYLDRVGETSGLIWRTLDEQGAMPLSKLLKQIDSPREIVLMSIGWLAREEKIIVEEVGRKRMIDLA
jgi:hypothetical protein